MNNAIIRNVYGKNFSWRTINPMIKYHLAEDTIDHRLNSRSIRMNRLHRYLYWNMNFHTEHHMFPSVPFHALPALSAATKADYPPQYSGFRAAYREIWSVYRQQKTEPNYYLDRSPLIPKSSEPVREPTFTADTSVLTKSPDGWIRVRDSSALTENNIIRFDYADATYAIYRLSDGRVRATDGLCTHAKVHLCDGAIIDGQIECPKHNGRFDIETGKAMSRPVTVDLTVHEIREINDHIEIRLA